MGAWSLTGVDQEMLFAEGDVTRSCVYKRAGAVAENGRAGERKKHILIVPPNYVSAWHARGMHD